MNRAVLDTNTIVSGIGWSGPPRLILDAAIAGAFVLLISADLLEEIRRVLTYPRLRALPPARVREVLALLPLIAQMVEPEGRISVVRQDPADNRVLECALAGEATHIVTGDDHLLALKSFRGVRIVAPAAFLKIVSQQT
ncbi:MAG: putative toxin-antitoxin system toxin component, PIN family [Candidatus Rokubacteria bacterium]|nr:putative toxin-antitoxin system toxin component, PIN family [Candidatus Rokubacteria bacterium]